MRLPRLVAAVAGFGLAALAAPTADAAAYSSAVPYLHLTTSISGPMFGDDSDVMYYAFSVTNDAASQTTATGIELKMTMLACTKKDEPNALCKPEPTYYQHIESLAPGKTHDGAIPIDLPNNQPELWLRFTAEISHVDQLVQGIAPDTCIYGMNPSSLCASTTDDLLP